jgi:hypothetical protein
MHQMSLYITVHGMQQHVHSASSPQGQLTQPEPLMGLVIEEVEELEMLLGGILGSDCSNVGSEQRNGDIEETIR